MDKEILEWLLDGDPAIRWQALRDLASAPAQTVTAEQERVGMEGWGARLLAQQDADGRWGGGLYTPKWISTTYTLLMLRGLGLPPRHPAALRGLEQIMAGGDFSRGGINLWRTVKYSDLCVDAMVLALLEYFQYADLRAAGLVEHLLDHQFADGGWNCEWYRGATHSSFHTTLSVLEALLETRLAHAAAGLDEAARRGEQFLLEHRLFRSHRSGAVVDPKMLRCSYPPRWRYDILRALDYFQAAGAPYDERMNDALDVLARKRSNGGTWKLENRHAGKTFFEMEPVGKPSRWNTLRALRVFDRFKVPEGAC